MAILGKLAVASIATLIGTAAAQAGMVVYGTSSARLCYEVTENMRPLANDVAPCNKAIEEERLSFYATVASYVNRGIVKRRTGDLDGALADFDRALEIDPDESEAYIHKAIALMMTGSGWNDAEDAFTQAIERGPRQPAIAYLGRGLANESAGDLRSAYADYARAAELAPDWPLPRTQLRRFRFN